MSADRDQGLNALQSGNAAEAVTLLERATQADPTDYQAYMYLGAAYGQVERHNEAVNALTQAVTLQPSNAQGRYNLGIAIERAGYAPQALEAYQQALELQPDYPKAQEAIQRLQPSAAAPSFAAPTDAQAAQPYAPPAETPTQYAPQGYAPQTPQYTPPPPQGGYAPPPGQQPTQGYGNQPPAYGQPTMMPGQPAPNAYGQPPAYPGGYAPGAYRGGVTYAEDKFDLKQAALDWVQIIRAPKTFFEAQAGRPGYKAPIAFLLFTALAQAAFSLIGGAMRPATLGVTLAAVAFSLTIGFAVTVLFLRLGAAIVHSVGKMFGNQAEQAGSFRAVTYCQAPFLIFSAIIALATPLLTPSVAPLGMALPEKPGVFLKQTQGSPNSPFGAPRPGRYNPSGSYNGGAYGGAGATQKSPFSNPALAGIMALGAFGVLIGLGFLLWYLVLLVMAISSIQQISVGSAVGTAIISLLVAFVILIGIGMLIGFVFVAAMSAAH